MIYAQFYRTDLQGQLAEGCGDRAVIILDGRRSLRFNLDLAAATALERGFEAYRLFKGETFTRSSPITEISAVRL